MSSMFISVGLRNIYNIFKMTNFPLLSVVIPVFNVENYLRKTLDCVLHQTYSNWELLLIDDGSTDSSFEIAKEYASKDKRIKLLMRDDLPKGAPTCRNIGLKKASGEYLIYLDSDDIIAPYCFQQRVEFIEANKCNFAIFPLVGFYQKLFDANGMIFGYKPEGDIVFNLLARSLPFVVVSNIYRRQSLVDSKVVWDTSFKSYQDSDYNLQVIRAGLTYKISNLLPDYFYRLSADNSICKKLFKASNCLSQVSFLEKQTAIYGDVKEYRAALLICAALIYQNILCAPDNGEVVKHFLNAGIFLDKKLLAMKLRLMARISVSIRNLKILDIFQLLLTPVFFARYKYHIIRWSMYNCNMYQEIKNNFEEVVSEDIRNDISDKI